MNKRSSYEIKKKIFGVLKESSANYAILERKVNTGFRTVKKNCEELHDMGFIKIKKKKKHPKNGKEYYDISLTKQGSKYIKKKI